MEQEEFLEVPSETRTLTKSGQWSYETSSPSEDTSGTKIEFGGVDLNSFGVLSDTEFIEEDGVQRSDAKYGRNWRRVRNVLRFVSGLKSVRTEVFDEAHDLRLEMTQFQNWKKTLKELKRVFSAKNPVPQAKPVDRALSTIVQEDDEIFIALKQTITMFNIAQVGDEASLKALESLLRKDPRQ